MSGEQVQPEVEVMVDHLKGHWPLNFEGMDNASAVSLRAMLDEYEGVRATMAKQGQEANDAIKRAMGWK